MIHRFDARMLALAVLLLSTGCASPDSSLHPQARLLWAGSEPDFRLGDVSPDGRFFADVNWASGDLDLVDLERGRVRPLTGRGYEAGRYAWASAFSPDGRRLAVSWYLYGTGAHELRVHDRDDGTSHVLVPARKRWDYLDPLDWSPSGDRILAADRRA